MVVFLIRRVDERYRPSGAFVIARKKRSGPCSSIDEYARSQAI